MRRSRLGRRPLLIAFAAFVVLIALAMVVSGRGGDGAPASRSTLERIAAKNREAAVASAARMKTDSEATAAAADARIEAEADAGADQASR